MSLSYQVNTTIKQLWFIFVSNRLKLNVYFMAVFLHIRLRKICNRSRIFYVSWLMVHLSIFYLDTANSWRCCKPKSWVGKKRSRLSSRRKSRKHSSLWIVPGKLKRQIILFHFFLGISVRSGESWGNYWKQFTVLNSGNLAIWNLIHSEYHISISVGITEVTLCLILFPEASLRHCPLRFLY